MPALSPGIYLVGCEDGSVTPLLVTLTANGVKVAGDKDRPHYFAVKMALGKPGFWWRRMVVPGVIPETFDSPHVSRLPEPG